MSKVKPIPDGFHSLTPYLVIEGAAEAIDFYKKAFGAKEINRMAGPGGRVMHAEMSIGDSRMMLTEAFPEMGSRGPKALGGSPAAVFLYVDKVDDVFNQAVAAGAKVKMPLDNMFWGDRFGKLTDPFGHEWALATHIEDVPDEEMGKRAQEAMAAMAECKS